MTSALPLSDFLVVDFLVAADFSVVFEAVVFVDFFAVVLVFLDSVSLVLVAILFVRVI